MADRVRARLIADLQASLAHYVDEAGVACPVESYVVLSRSEA
jgi:hypothetical protein